MESLPEIIGPYRVSRQLGAGGMGAVFEAVHEVIQRRVAIKVLHPEADRSTDTINRFINEARAANLVGHPGLVQITDFGNLPDGSGYLVMEYLGGETLAMRLERSGAKLSPSDAVQISVQIASAVAAAHKKGIIHRDLKPSNIMLVPDSAMPTAERVKILDFGLAKLSEVREAAVVKTNSQAVLGTPLYMSPEQCEGAGRVDAKTDVYSLGCILYEMLAGQLPFVGDGPGQIIGQHLFKVPPPLRKVAKTVPVGLAEFVDSLLVKAKEQRPSMREVERKLEALSTELPPPPRRHELVDRSEVVNKSKVDALGFASTLGHGAAESASSKPRRRRVFAVVGAAALLSLGGFVFLLNPKLAARLVQPVPVRQAAPATTGAPALPPPAPPATERTIRWSVESIPPKATLVDAQGVVLGETPWLLVRPVGNGTQEVHMHKPGYTDKLLVLKQDSNEARQERLESVPAPPPRKKGTVRPAPAGSSAHKSAQQDSAPKNNGGDPYVVPLVH